MPGEQRVTDDFVSGEHTHLVITKKQWADKCTAHHATEAQLKTVLDREAATIKRYEDKLDEAEAKLRAALAETSLSRKELADYRDRLEQRINNCLNEQDRADAAEAKLRAALAEVERWKSTAQKIFAEHNALIDTKNAAESALAATKLAEAGCTDREIQAITGHESQAMVAHYRKEADQRISGRAAMDKMEIVNRKGGFTENDR